MLLFASETFISPDDVWSLWALILVGVAISIYLEQTFRWAARISGPVLALLIAMLLSNLQIMPAEAPAYDVIGKYLVPSAVALLLFRASLIEIARTTGTMFIAMQLAIVGTTLGTLLAVWLLQGRIESLAEISGMIAASYSGGGVNLFAVKQIYNVDDGLTSSLLVADNIVMAAAFLVLFSMASRPILRRLYRHLHSMDADQSDARALAKEHWQRKPIALLDIAKALAIAVAIGAASHHLAKAATSQVAARASESETAHNLTWQVVGSLVASPFVWVTLLAITAATLFGRHLSRIHGTDELGGYLLYVFLFSIGLPSDFWQVIRQVPLMFALCAIIAVVNIGFTMLLGKLLRLNLEELLLACNASLGGPPTAAAMAVSMGWPRLVTPALLIGLWGYVVGTALGVAVTEGVRLYLSG